MASCATFETGRLSEEVLQGKVICLDPGHGGTADTDFYRIGPTGEREEWIDLRIALLLKEMLEARGARVLMTRTEDVPVALKDRADLAVENQADVILSIHHNATADPDVNFPIIYFHGYASENPASVQLARCLAQRLRKAIFSAETPVSVVSDRVIFPTSGTAVLRHSYGIPGVIGEASFFSNPEEEQRLKDPEYNRKEAAAYVAALEDFFSQSIPPILPKNTVDPIEPFQVFQEADRMNEEARRWKANYEEAVRLMKHQKSGLLEEAFDKFTLSARAFPDSPVARDCHRYRAEILERLGRQDEAKQERRRVMEFYPNRQMSF